MVLDIENSSTSSDQRLPRDERLREGGPAVSAIRLSFLHRDIRHNRYNPQSACDQPVQS